MLIPARARPGAADRERTSHGREVAGLMSGVLVSPIINAMEQTATDTAVRSVLSEQVMPESLGAAGLDAYARALAKSLQVVSVQETRRALIARRRREIRESIDSAATTIERAYSVASEIARAGNPLMPDAEWLMDNYYIVDELIRDIRDHMPAGFLSELPSVASGRPRVYELARELVLHSDSGLDEELIERFVENFQSGALLSIGETWALPTMLRLVLLEQLRKLSEQFLHGNECRVKVARLLEQSESPTHFDLDFSSLTECGPTISELSEQLRGQGSTGANSLKILERQVQNLGWDLSDLVRLEHRRQAANQVSMGNVITSMRLLGTLDWIGFFEHINRAEQILRRDPAGVYTEMDFASRNRYRSVIERIAKGTQQSDQVVAQSVLDICEKQSFDGARHDPLRMHVGYWLVGPGAAEFERHQGYRRPTTREIAETLLHYPHATYFGTLTVLMLVLVSTLVAVTSALELPILVQAVIVILALIPLSDVALSTLNSLLTRVVPPRLLPKLEFEQGIPEQFPTIVVVPSLLSSRRDVETLLDRLENHYLANADRMLRFALLSDYADAPTAEQSTDRELLRQAVEGVRQLNIRYGDQGCRPFYLFHRRRLWNASEGVWMGWERKRGKLMEFGNLLRGQTDTSFIVQEGDLAGLDFLKAPQANPFIITLDADTILPRDTARRLVGTLAHPLNRPRLSADGRCVQSGYTILQPRVSVHLAGTRQTRFAQIFANSPGVDPYATCASDVYQDLFAEGSFTGKGIYDLHAFERALGEAFPENMILSHDLIEGCHARVALVSDIEVYDSYPVRYDADLKRTHRWIRGDWQIAPWLFSSVPYASGRQKNRLSLLSRWKIAENLRRSLALPSLCLLLVVAWLIGGAAAWTATLLGLIILFFPVVLHVFNVIAGLPSQKYPANYLKHGHRELLRVIEQCAYQVTFLLHKSVVMVDAIVRTLFRMSISRRRMLQWETAAAVETRLSDSRWSVIQQMWFCPVVSAAVFAAAPSARISAAPFLLAWLIAPLTAYLLSRPRPAPMTGLGTGDRQWLRHLASATWSYFETYVNEESNWLPPDNVQDYPREKIAHRISPTNEGLFLVSGLAARDLGFIGLTSLLDVWERNWTTWQKLEQMRGHHYNWYETRSLQSLPPRYISTVDSGNLVACYLTLHSGIQDLLNAPILDKRMHTGLLDSLRWLEGAARQLFSADLAVTRRQVIDEVLRTVIRLQHAIADPPGDASSWQACFSKLDAAQQRLEQLVDELSTEEVTGRLSKKTKILIDRVAGIRHDVSELLPWILFSSEDADAEDDAAVEPSPRMFNTDRIRSLRDVAGLLEHSAGPLDDRARAAAAKAKELIARFERLAGEFERSASEMDFRFLFNQRRKLFSIGFNVEESRLDRSHYDMLCSESRLASYLAIAKGDTDTTHWFRLGRQSTQVDRELLLISWGGTMFEYLMPSLFQKQYRGSLLTESAHAAIRRQRNYGKERSVPWGISESAYSSLASNSDYQYRSFGVPGLGLKRGLAKDLVVSPYSTMLALPLEPVWAIENLRALDAEGGMGDWGFYEALDYTPSRLRRGKRIVQVECYMAHHQGMSLTALANANLDNVMQRRFHDHPWARANELLLQERVPQMASPNRPHAGQLEQAPIPRDDSGLVSRRITGIQTATPRTHILSNGQTSVMVTHVGGGYMQWQDQLVTRWRRDTTRDNWGTFIYLHDVQSGEVWSATYQPTLVKPDGYEVIFAMDKAEFHRRQGDIESTLEVAVSPENNAEVRQLRLVNHGSRVRYIDVTSYAEVVLNTLAADQAHPAFQKLFIETEYIPEETSLIARRRPRSAGQAAMFAVHTIVAPNGDESSVQFETSRLHFLGRNRSPESPLGASTARLGGTVGAVLDPVFALRCRVTLAPDEAVTISFTTAVAQSREQALALADQYHDQRGTHRAFELAWAFAQSESRHRGVDGSKMHLYQRLGSALLYPDRSLRGDPAVLKRNRMGQPGLWRYGISGDLPIIACRVTDTEHVALVTELVAAHRFLVEHGLYCDLVILNDYPGSYFDALQDQLQTIVNDAQLGDRRHGANHLLRGAQLPPEDHVLIETVASCVLSGNAGDLAQQLDMAASSSKHLIRQVLQLQPLHVNRPSRRYPPLENDHDTQPDNLPVEQTEDVGDVEFHNGLGGFVADGRAYQITVNAAARTPAPWSNVIANARFGTLVTESGGGFTWFRNSRENKLTAWSNDPVTDKPSELIYVRDEQAQELWSPLASLTAVHGTYHCRHGHGYSRFQHVSHALEHEVMVTVATEDPVKFVRVRIHNTGEHRRTLTLTYYVDWVLGVMREQNDMVVVTERDESTGALLATNHYSMEFAEQVAFLQVLGQHKTVTGDRRAFIGRNGSLTAPVGLAADDLDGHTGAGLDPCGAIQTKVTIAPATTEEVVFLVGAGDSREEALNLLEKYGDPVAVTAEIQQSVQTWQHTLGALRVKTPDRGLDVMVNGWLQYQTLSCRLWGRSAFYQSGGAYGFRDQLQDVMALVNTRPDLTRQQILRAAARQFKEGDVQHWWHPPGGKGTRTRFSDDFLFLPYVTDFYLRSTGDTSILDADVPFLVSAPLHEHEQERYEQPQEATETASLYEHCLRALQHGLRYGAHGLPLMGCGDWNDGMNKVGEGGQGESVWVAFFQIVVFEKFSRWMHARNDEANAQKFLAEAARLRRAVEEEAWDGQWYRRAFFDDGTPLGSHVNDECRIDSLSQSWSVIAGADTQRAAQAMRCATEQLVREEDGLIMLFTPPFDQSPLDPGYIKGYLPGIRENGAQYTHAATWMVEAAARLGDGELALKLFNIINPIQHALTPEDVARYRVEPYVVAADVYSVEPHVGAGGWTWYTGSASWTYRIAVESILGIDIQGNVLNVQPCVPQSWQEFEFTLRRGSTTWTVHMHRGATDAQPFSIELNEDGGQHHIEGTF